MLCEKAGQDELLEIAAVPGTPVGKALRLFGSGGRRAVFLGSTAVYLYDQGDKEAEVACIATLSRAGLAKDVEIASAFGVHRNTVGRVARRFEREGMAAVVAVKKGPKRPWKVTPEVMRLISSHAELPRKALQELVGKQTGTWLSLSRIYELAGPYRPEQMELKAGPPAGEEERSSKGASQAAEGQEHVSPQEGQVGGPAGTGADEPPAELPEATSGRYMGLALYYPALAAVGLLDIARQLYRLPRSVRFGVRATTLCLFFMTVLSKTTLEAAKHLRRAELGVMAGSTVAPCVKTLRRKLAALVQQSKAAKLGEMLARHWVESGLVATAYLYIDGHMKACSGKRRLQEVWNSQRRMPLPGVHTYFVGDQAGRPLLFLAEELSTNLAKAMPAIIAEIKKVVGDRQFTVVFDRGGFDGKLFSWLRQGGHRLHHLPARRAAPGNRGLQPPRSTYRGAGGALYARRRQGKSRPLWPLAAHRGTHQGRPPDARPHEPRPRSGRRPGGGADVRPLGAGKFLQVHGRAPRPRQHRQLQSRPRRPRCHRPQPSPKGHRPPHQRGPQSPRHAESQARRRCLGRAEGRGPFRARAEGRPRGKGEELRGLEAKIAGLVAERRALPERVSAAEAGGREVTQREAKAIVDRIKIGAYNAEEWLLDRLVVHYHNGHDVRDLLRAFAELSGTIDTTPAGVVVSLDPPDTPLHREALRGLVGDLNATGATFPGTDVPVTYEVRLHHSEVAA